MQTWPDTKTESRPGESESIYVPRDEEWEDIKRETIDQRKLIAMARNVVPALIDNIIGSEGISNIDYFIKKPGHTEFAIQSQLPLSWNLLNLSGAIEEFFKFDPPKIFSSMCNQIVSISFLDKQIIQIK